MSKNVTEKRRRSRASGEWEDDPYDPSHYTGEGDAPLRLRAPTRYGWLLIIGAGVILVFAILTPVDGVLYWYYLTLQICLALLAIAAGLRLLRGSNG